MAVKQSLPVRQSVYTLPDPDGMQRLLYRFPLLGYRLGLGGVLDQFRIAALTTRGRRSGQPRFAALEYRQHGSKVYIISGWGERANWVQNVRHDPEVTLRRGARVERGRATIVTDRSETFRALSLFYHSNPAYYERWFKRMGQRDRLDALTLPQVADNVLVVRINPEPGAPVLPPAPVDAQALGVAIALALLVLLAGLVVAGARFARRSR